ncbi:hypothetical protein Q8W71_25095 [Methylobacterium sp. NEAU 140]|uniref:hypothetical protein n=1 Tax=Methylobacterium sp. NEAU 140 TaxID=3064945 RepID=UPI0027323BF1|nr:hypothetical protein [Methylobacterium sp. NEAU 140]MDP4025913.1 hypothetical protein [Methylobacterium sp. NEAU 140]
MLAILAIAGLAWLAARRETLPPPGRVTIGPGWTAVTLAPYRAAPRLWITADVPFSLRIDGDRVTRAVPGAGAVLRPRALRSLELRSGRGQATVTLTPRAE